MAPKVLTNSRFSYLKTKNLEKDLTTQIEDFFEEGKVSLTIHMANEMNVEKLVM